MDAGSRRGDSERLLRMQRDLAIALSSAADVETVGRLVLDACLQVEGIGGGGLYLVDQRTGALDLVSSAGLTDAFVERVRHFEPSSPQARLVMQGDPIAKPYSDLAPAPDPVRTGEGLGIAIVLPIRHEGGVIACLNLASRRQADPSSDSRQALAALAAYSAGAIARVRAEKALADNRRNLQNLFASMQDLLFVVDLDGRIVHVNPAVEARMDLPASAIVGRHALDLYAPQHRDEAAKVLGEMFTAGRVECTIPLQAADGSSVPMELRVSHGRWDDREALFGISRDVSERLRAESALRDSEERFRVIAEMSSDFAFVIRVIPDGPPRIEWVVGAFQTITGLTVDEFNRLVAAGDPPVDPDDLAALQALLEPVPGDRVSTIEFRLRARDGRIRSLRATTRFEADRQREGHGRVMGSVTDVTEARRLEESLRHSQKMEGIGRLAGGVAHDFNNLLQPILGHAELLSLSMDVDDPKLPQVEVIREAARRAKALVSQLLAFGRKQVLEAVPVDLDRLVREFHPILRSTIRENIEIRLDLRSSPACVKADPARLDQVLLNLAINAQDAMPKGGVLRLSTFVEMPDGHAVGHRSTPVPGPHVVLSIRDDGVGMSDETMSHLFEPFFTTKERGRGTGLGLATTYGIVRQHGGAIDVASSPGLGSEFRVVLPVFEGVPASVPGGAEPAVPPRGSGTVLVVEDDDLVRGFVCQILGMHGFQAVPLASPEACLRHVADGHDEACLLVSDIVLPGMNGFELHRRLSGDRPGMPVLYITGYAENLLQPTDGPGPGDRLLNKPFTPGELMERVRASLAANPPASDAPGPVDPGKG